jgi:predicted RNA-binding Zn-ribbon protein involved in translation (DUF1610 family)
MEGIMSDFVTLTCPSCGAKLEITPDMDRFACGYCGTEEIVRRAGGAISLAPVVEGLNQVRAGVDKTASELAIKRLREEIAILQVSLDDMKAQYAALKEPKFPMVTFLICAFLILGGFITALSPDMDAGTRGFSVVIILVSAGVAFLVTQSTAKKTEKFKVGTKQPLEKRFNDIKETLVAKQGELQDHLKIVSSR